MSTAPLERWSWPADDIDDSSAAHKFTSATEIAKLAGIETGATTDQTGAEIKSLYEGEADTNAFTDAEKTKLAGIGTVKISLTPTTGFSETVTQDSADKWLVLNPAGALASGTIALVAPGSATDGPRDNNINNQDGQQHNHKRQRRHSIWGSVGFGGREFL